MKEIDYAGRVGFVPEGKEAEVAEMLSGPLYMLTVRHVDEDGRDLCKPSVLPTPVGKKIALMSIPAPLLSNGLKSEKDLYIIESMPAKAMTFTIEYRKSWPK